MSKAGYDYFKGFCDNSECAGKAAKMLAAFLKNYDYGKAPEQMNEIHKIEHESDEVKHTMMEHLAKEFLPPIERGDISTLANELDNVVDGIDEVMRLLCMFRIKELRPDVQKFTELLVTCCDALGDVVQEFVNFKKSKTIKEKIIKVNTLESEGDTIHFAAMDTLFSLSTDAIGVMAWKDIYDCFENCFDATEHAADVIQEIILANT